MTCASGFRMTILALAVSAFVAAGASGLTASQSGPLVSVFAAGKSITEVLDRLARDAGVEILVEPAVKGAIDLSLQDVPFETALNAICRASGLKWEEMAAGEGRKVYLVRVRAAEPPRDGDRPRASTPRPPQAARSREKEAPASASQPQEQPASQRPVDPARAMEFLGRASRVDYHAADLPPYQPPATVKVGPPLVPPVYYYGYPVIPVPPYGYGGVWVMPYKTFVYTPVQPVWRNPRFYPGYSGLSVGIDSPGMKLRYTDVRLQPR
ncbi:MAG: hypothetical protein KatS3mg024_2159 [Armatimonadota bacterium]|nr:MAG: hypothetical protein KatS3mg024_2159 [Armatimonadota bacterium]